MMQNPPKISIIIPVYNMEKHIERCLNHVRTQTLQDIEILCCDDGSQDNSLAMLHKYAETDSRIRVLSEPNQGAGLARNACLRVATGEFVSFLDADDEYYDATSLEKLYMAAKEHGVTLCGGATYPIEKNHHVHSGKMTELKKGFLTPATYQFNFGYQSFIYNLNLLKENQILFPSYLRYQDAPFFLKAQLAAKEFFCIPHYTYKYNCHQKPLNFYNHKKVNDLIVGLTSDISTGEIFNLNEFVKSKISRINLIYYKIFIKSYLNGNTQVENLLHELNNKIQYQLIQNIYPYSPKENFITPLIEIERIKAIHRKNFLLSHQLKEKILKVNSAWTQEAKNLDPYDMSYRTKYISMLLTNGKIKECYQETTNLINDFPDDSTGWMQQSFLEEQQGNLPHALACARKAVQLEPEYPDIYEHFCNMLRANGQEEEAEKTARLIADKHPDLGWPWRQLSWLESDRGRGYLALKYARKSVDVEPDKLDLRPWLEDLLQREGLHAEARNVLDETLEKDPWCEWALHRKIQSLLEDEQSDSQKNLCEAFPLLKKALLLKKPQHIQPFIKKYIKASYKNGRMEAFSQSASLGMGWAERVRMFLWYGLPGWFRQAGSHGERA